MSWGEVVIVAIVGGALVALAMRLVRVRQEPVPELPNPLAASPSVTASLTTLGPQLAEGQPAHWLAIALGNDRRAVESVVASLQPGLPESGPFEVNRLVGGAPVRVSGHVTDGVPVVTAVERLDAPGGA